MSPVYYSLGRLRPGYDMLGHGRSVYVRLGMVSSG
jgi:hypothetical protein